MLIKETISFDDVLLVPKYSKIESRSNVDLSVTFKKNDDHFKFSTPIIPANMKTVTGPVMARHLAKAGSLSILHRFMSVDEQISIFNNLSDVKDHHKLVALSVGVKPEDKEIVDTIVKNGVRVLCIDIAHAHSLSAVEMCSYISKHYPWVLLIAGNVATAEGAQTLWEAGADVVKVGVGSGSICTTRIETGNGVPQLSAIVEVAQKRRELSTKYMGKRTLYIISDGGVKIPADVCKALCFTDMVMAGNIFAGTDESPGDVVEVDGHSYKNYVGSSTHKSTRKEGVEALVPYKGPVDKVLSRYLEGLQSCCSYQGVSKVKDLQTNPEFLRITHSGLLESHPHDVKLTK